jgi:hypothetical protein
VEVRGGERVRGRRREKGRRKKKDGRLCFRPEQCFEAVDKPLRANNSKKPGSVSQTDIDLERRKPSFLVLPPFYALSRRSRRVPVLPLFPFLSTISRRRSRRNLRLQLAHPSRHLLVLVQEELHFADLEVRRALELEEAGRRSRCRSRRRSRCRSRCRSRGRSRRRNGDGGR